MHLFHARVALAGVVALLFAACTASAAPPRHWTWRSLHRPLHVPAVAPGAACPVSALTSVDLGVEGLRRLPARGPAYPTLGGDDATTLDFDYPPLTIQQDFYGSGWGGNKVLWWVAGTYRGPVLIRGRQLDGPHELRFDGAGLSPPREIRIPPSPGYRPWKGARARGSYTRLQAPGCYAYQIDGTSFSRLVVFRASVIPPP